MERPNGKYCRLVDLQSSAEGIKEESFRLSINKAMESIDLKDDGADDADDADGTTIKNNETSNDDDDGSGSFSMMRVWKLATPDTKYLITGSIGAIITGAILPVWGVLLALTMEILYTPIEPCNSTVGECNSNYAVESDEIRTKLYYLSLYWTIIIVGVVAIGSVFLLIWGLGMSCESLSKKICDNAFGTLLRQVSSCSTLICTFFLESIQYRHHYFYFISHSFLSYFLVYTGKNNAVYRVKCS